jgi:large subunit ribosomal protein L22
MEYTSTAKYIRTSPRKVRLVADAVRKLPLKQAMTVLAQKPKRAAHPLLMVITSAVANAKLQGGTVDNLRFKTVEVMEGPMMKRWRAVSRGRAHPFNRRMTHIRIVLTDKTEEKQ